MRYLLLFAVIWAGANLSLGAQERVMYRIILKDKGEAGYSVERPEEFLSPKSIERREKQGFAVDESDLPIAPAYFAALTDLGAEIKAYSKWVKTISIEIDEVDGLMENIRQLPFVEKMELVWHNKTIEHEHLSPQKTKSEEAEYGDAFAQINILNGLPMHERGFRGEGLTIAVFDAGFVNVDALPHFDWDKIVDVRDFTHEDSDMLRNSHDHGTKTLSCMLGNKAGEIIGTAPMASYCLFKTEVNADEFPIEEDYWVRALEYADSLGVDIVSSSLGYFNFNDPSMNHTHAMLDGETVLISRAASMAASKGMIVSTSAGNEGNKDWEKIIFPADANHVLTVGGITANYFLSTFSSAGYSADGRVKPDIVALATNAYVITQSGGGFASGTSFSCPAVSGMLACLWQALPEKNSFEIMELVKQSANMYSIPNKYFGYGLPDFFQAYQSGTSEVSIKPAGREELLFIDSETVRTSIDSHPTSLQVFSPTGERILCSSTGSVGIGGLEKGIYIAVLLWDNRHYSRKFIIR